MTEWTCARIASRTERKRSTRSFSSVESRVRSAAGVAMVSSYRGNAARCTRSVTPFRRGVFDFQEELLRRAEPRRRLERSKHGLFGVVELVRREVGLREIEQRASLVERAQRHDTGVLADGASIVLLLQPHRPEAPMEILIVHRVDVV